LLNNQVVIIFDLTFKQSPDMLIFQIKGQSAFLMIYWYEFTPPTGTTIHQVSLHIWDLSGSIWAALSIPYSSSPM